MRTFLGATGSVLAVLVVPVLFVLVNGGLTYRIQCPTAEGTVKTRWSYEWNQPIPYLLAPTETGCEVHSATHVLASKAGIAKLDEHGASSVETSATASGETVRFVAGASGVLAAVSDDWVRQKRAASEAQGLSRRETVDLLRRSSATTHTVYGEQIRSLERLPAPSDDDLAALRTSLAEWLRIQLSANEVLLDLLDRGASKDQFERDLTPFSDDLRTRRITMLRLRAVLPSRYPELDRWAFLDESPGG